MEFEYEIHIGKSIDAFDITKQVPKRVIEITKAQLDVIELFAYTRVDGNLNKVYNINQIEFTIHPKMVLPHAKL